MKLNTQLTYRETSSIFSGSVVAGKDQKTNIYYFNRLARKLPVETGEQDYRTSEQHHLLYLSRTTIRTNHYMRACRIMGVYMAYQFFILGSYSCLHDVLPAYQN
jgi:hypothetical protein